MIEASTQGYDSRDEAQTKLLSLKEKADKEVAQYEMEVKVHTYAVICCRTFCSYVSNFNEVSTH